MDRNPPVVLLQPPDPSFAEPSSQTFDLSPVSFLLALLAVVTIPTLIYTFFLFIKCPPNPFRPSRRSSLTPTDESTATDGDDANSKELVSGVKYRKESHVKEVGSECPVCLSVYADGEEVRQLTVCKHSFHASCIDTWLYSHSNCPICRASVAGVKQRNNKSVGEEDDDLRQGLPDSASLV